MADNLMSGSGDIRRSYDDSGGYGKYGLGDIPHRHSGKTHRCNKRCPYLTNKPSCTCPEYLLDRYFGINGKFGIDKGKYGDGCPIYVRAIKGKQAKEYR